MVFEGVDPVVHFLVDVAVVHVVLRFFADNTRHYPGHGTIDYASVLRALRQIDYRGWVSMEYLPLPDEATATRVGFDYIRALEQAVAME